MANPFLYPNPIYPLISNSNGTFCWKHPSYFFSQLESELRWTWEASCQSQHQFPHSLPITIIGSQRWHLIYFCVLHSDLHPPSTNKLFCRHVFNGDIKPWRASNHTFSRFIFLKGLWSCLSRNIAPLFLEQEKEETHREIANDTEGPPLCHLGSWQKNNWCILELSWWFSGQDSVLPMHPKTTTTTKTKQKAIGAFQWNSKQSWRRDGLQWCRQCLEKIRRKQVLRWEAGEPTFT